MMDNMEDDARIVVSGNTISASMKDDTVLLGLHLPIDRKSSSTEVVDNTLRT